MSEGVCWRTPRWCHTRTNITRKSKRINQSSSRRVWVLYRTGTVSLPMIRNSCRQVRPGRGRDGSVLTCERAWKELPAEVLVPPSSYAPLPSFFPSHCSSTSFSLVTMPACHFVLAGEISHYQEGKWDCIEKQWEFDWGLRSLGDYFELVTGLLSNNPLKVQIEWTNWLC